MSRFVYNPLTGRFDIVGEGGSGGGDLSTLQATVRELQDAIDSLKTYFDTKYDAINSASAVQNNLDQLSSNVAVALSERYLKTETYSKDEVDDNIAEAINTHIINVINNTEF